MDRNFYGLINNHGAYVKWDFQDGTEDYSGAVKVFSSKKERDAWVDGERLSEFVSTYHYQPIDKATARRLMEREVIADSENTREDVRSMTTNELVSWYNAVMSQWFAGFDA